MPGIKRPGLIKRGWVLLIVLVLLLPAVPSSAAVSPQGKAPQAAARVKFVHFSPYLEFAGGGSGPVNVRVDGEQILSDFSFKDISEVHEIAPGEHTLSWVGCLTCTLPLEQDSAAVVNLAPDTDYVLAIIGNEDEQPVEWLKLENKKPEPSNAPEVENVRFRLTHLAPVSAQLANTRVDVCTDEGSLVPGLANIGYKELTDPYIPLPKGDHDLKVTKAGTNCATTVLDLPSLRIHGEDLFNPGNFADLFIIGDNKNKPVSFASVSGVSPTPKPRLKFAHFASYPNSSKGSTALKFKVDSLESKDFQFGDIGANLTLDPGEHTLSWIGCLTCTLPLDQSGSMTVNLDYDTNYTAVVIGNDDQQPVEMLLHEEGAEGGFLSSKPEATGFKLRVENLAPISGVLQQTKIDICTDAGAVVNGLAGIPYKGHGEAMLSLEDFGDKERGFFVALAGKDCADSLLDLPPLHRIDGDFSDGFINLQIIGDGLNQPLIYASTSGKGFVPKPKVRFAHFAPFDKPRAATAIDISIDDKILGDDLKFGQITSYDTIEIGTTQAKCCYCLTCTLPVDVSYTLPFTATFNSFYTIVAVGNERNRPFEMILLEDERIRTPVANAAEAGETGKLRAGNFASFDESLNVDAIDFCTQEGNTVPGLTNIPYKGFTIPYLDFPIGVHDFIVAEAGTNCANQLSDPPPILIREGRVGSLFALGDGLDYPLQTTIDEDISLIKQFITFVTR